jgi:hypothetical protein
VAYVHVGKSGAVRKVRIASATHPALGHALRAGLEACSFRPFDNRTGEIVLRRKEVFQSKPAKERKLARGRRDPVYCPASINLSLSKGVRVHKLADLDSPIDIVISHLPRFPLSVAPDAKGEVTMDFVVGGNGRVYAPSVRAMTNEAFAYSAIQGLSTWGFTTPEVKGRPVFVNMTVTFSFDAGKVTFRINPTTATDA